MERAARLQAISGEHGGKSYPLVERETLIGRGEECDVQIIDSRISRNHARLSFEEGAWVLEDLGSTHGTFIKGERVEKAILQHGDTITIGETILRFEGATSQDAIPTEMVTPFDDDVATVMEGPDAIPTEMASPDDIATVMESADDVPTRLVSPDDQETVLSVDRDQGAVEMKASPLPPVMNDAQSDLPRVTPPPAPPHMQSVEGKPFPWTWVAIGGGVLAVILIVGVGLSLVGGLIGDRGIKDPGSGPADEQIILTIEAQGEDPEASTALIPPTLTLTIEPQPTPTTDQETGQATADPLPTPSPEPDLMAAPILGGSAQLAYASDRFSRPQIFLIDLETQEERQLTDISGGACQPAWSSDGSVLAFTSPCNINREEYSGSSVFMMDVDPAGNPGLVTQLIPTVGGGDYDPAWSRDGSRLAFTSWRTGRPQIFTANPDGSDLKNVNDDLAYNWAPTWSGDGAELAFLTGRGGQEEIWTVPVGGGDERRFSRSDGKDVARPVWSPDGSVIVFEKIVGNIPRLIAAPVADGGVRELQVCQDDQLSLQPMGEPAWSPDGEWLAFETWPDGVNHEIAIMRSGCTEYRQLTSAASGEFDAAWRPVP